MAECIDRAAALKKLMQDGCSAKNVQSIMEIPAVSVPQWISVKERMPEENDRVLAYFPDMNGSDCEIQISKGWALNKFVSHWMPLPEAPKGENDG